MKHTTCKQCYYVLQGSPDICEWCGDYTDKGVKKIMRAEDKRIKRAAYAKTCISLHRQPSILNKGNVSMLQLTIMDKRK